jgi:Fe2+ or Zn2+ uptake regulation protein
MSHQKLNYANLLRERGYRFTPQRALILDAVSEGRGHTTIEEIYREP